MAVISPCFDQLRVKMKNSLTQRIIKQIEDKATLYCLLYKERKRFTAIILELFRE